MEPSNHYFLQKKIDKYLITKFIAEGSFGKVFLAVD